MNAFECVGAQRILRPNELFIRNPLICLPKEPPTFLTTVGSPWISPETGHRSFPVHHKNISLRKLQPRPPIRSPEARFGHCRWQVSIVYLSLCGR